MDRRIYKFPKRFFDIAFSILVILTILSWLIPLVALIIFLESGEKTFFTQERIGENGMPFKIYKFKSMKGNPPDNDPLLSKDEAKRITKFGCFLRKFRIDEFPQFFNVLKGEMSIIGPRPERPFFVNELSRIIPFYETRHIIKPGLTGWAQVKTRYGSSVNDSLSKLQYDLYYIKHRSVFLDFNIFIKTLSTVLYYRGQ